MSSEAKGESKERETEKKIVSGQSTFKRGTKIRIVSSVEGLIEEEIFKMEIDGFAQTMAEHILGDLCENKSLVTSSQVENDYQDIEKKSNFEIKTMDLFADELTNEILQQTFVLNDPFKIEVEVENNVDKIHNQECEIQEDIKSINENIQECLTEKVNNIGVDSNDDFYFEESTNDNLQESLPIKVKTNESDSINDFYFEECTNENIQESLIEKVKTNEIDSIDDFYYEECTNCLENSSDVDDSFSCASVDKNSFSEKNLNLTPKLLDSFQEVQIFDDENPANESIYDEIYFELFQSKKEEFKTGDQDEAQEEQNDFSEKEFENDLHGTMKKSDLKNNGFHSEMFLFEKDDNLAAFETPEVHKTESFVDSESKGFTTNLESSSFCLEKGNSESSHTLFYKIKFLF